MQRMLITVGVIFVVAGVLWPWLHRLGLGHLPGDILIERKNFRLYLPVTTMIIVSLALSLIVWLLRK